MRMSRTNDLRKAIQSVLVGLKSAYSIKDIYYREADEKKMYPHIVYDLPNAMLVGLDRHDTIVNIDIYSKDNKEVEDIADAVEDSLHVENLPQENILPTFFLENRQNIRDEDINVRHILLKFVVQNYER